MFLPVILLYNELHCVSMFKTFIVIQLDIISECSYTVSNVVSTDTADSIYV